MRLCTSDRLGPFGIAGALFLWGMMLLISDATPVSLKLPGRGTQLSLRSDMEHALAVVQATMVEFPSDETASTIADLLTKINSSLIENEYLSQKIHNIDVEYKTFIEEYYDEMTNLRNSIQNMNAKFLLFREQHLYPYNVYFTDQTNERYTDHSWLLDDYQKQITLKRGTIGDAYGKKETNLDIYRSNNKYLKSYGESNHVQQENAESSKNLILTNIVQRIVDATQSVREHAIQMGEERVLYIDVLNKRLITHSKQSFLSNPRLNINLRTARSELVNDHTAGVRFYPNGTSTGGQIELELDGAKASVRIDWSTGVAHVD